MMSLECGQITPNPRINLTNVWTEKNMQDVRLYSSNGFERQQGNLGMGLRQRQGTPQIRNDRS